MNSNRIQLAVFLFGCVALLAFVVQRVLRCGVIKGRFGVKIRRDSEPFFFWTYVGLFTFVLVGALVLLVGVLIGTIHVT
jgi:hypothetical protein